MGKGEGRQQGTAESGRRQRGRRVELEDGSGFVCACVGVTVCWNRMGTTAGRESDSGHVRGEAGAWVPRREPLDRVSETRERALALAGHFASVRYISVTKLPHKYKITHRAARRLSKASRTSKPSRHTLHTYTPQTTPYRSSAALHRHAHTPSRSPEMPPPCTAPHATVLSARTRRHVKDVRRTAALDARWCMHAARAAAS